MSPPVFPARTEDKQVSHAPSLTASTVQAYRIKYSVSGAVLDKHCKALFIKHVFPRFRRPHSPLRFVSVNIGELEITRSPRRVRPLDMP